MPSYGPGSAGFGPTSIVVLALLLAFVAAATWIALHRPQLVALADRMRTADVVTRGRGWAEQRLRQPARALARRFSLSVVAGVALLVGLGVVVALGAAFTEVLDDVLEGDGIAALDQPATRWLASHRDLWLTWALKVVTVLGNSAVVVVPLIVVCAVVGWRRRSDRDRADLGVRFGPGHGHAALAAPDEVPHHQ